MSATVQTELPPAQRQELRQRATEDFYFFAKGILGFDWLTPHIHLPLCQILEQHNTLTRVKVTLPRSWLKTTVCSIAYPIWRAVRDPNIRCLLTQNTITNAISKLRSIDGVFLQNDLFRALWPELLPDKHCVWKTESKCIKRDKALVESTFEAAGIRTQVTSRHYDIIIEDDTVAPDLDELGEENIAPTKDDIDQAIGWHRLATPLLVDTKKSQIIVVGTRWFEKDLLSWIDAHERSYTSYERAVRETDGRPDPQGPLTYPERFDETVLEQIKDSLGPYMFSCLYLNKPMASDDMVFRKEWFKFYETPPEQLMVYTTVDPAGDPKLLKKRRNDYNVVMTCGKDMKTGRVYVLEYQRRRCSPKEVIEMLLAQVRKYDPVKVGIEGNAYQHTFAYWVKERMRDEKMYFHVEVMNTRSTKENRIRGLQPLVHSGQMFFRTHQTELMSELEAFPLGANDDVADALAMQLDLMGVTVGAKLEKPKGFDPFSLEGAIQELRQRFRKVPGLVFDVARTQS